MLLAGRYEVIQQIGGGGFAITYLAKDQLQPSKPQCVIKQLSPHQTNPTVLNLFYKEAAILEKLGEHPQIPRLLAHFSENNCFYIAQEFIEGHDLDTEILLGKQLSESYVVQLLKNVLEILAFVHKHNVIHRDIKPGNLIRRQRDGSIFLIDFGAVKQLSSTRLSAQGKLASTVIIGTPGYMPYEQSTGNPCLASDIYALGMVAIYALTGIAPNQLEEDPQTGEVLWQAQASVSQPLRDFLTKMIRRHYSYRYASAVEALQALNSITPSHVNLIPSVYSTQSSSSKTKATQQIVPLRNQKILRRKTLGFWGLFGASITLVGLGVIYFGQSIGEKPVNRLLVDRKNTQPLPTSSSVKNSTQLSPDVNRSETLPSSNKTAPISTSSPSVNNSKNNPPSSEVNRYETLPSSSDATPIDTSSPSPSYTQIGISRLYSIWHPKAWFVEQGEEGSRFTLWSEKLPSYTPSAEVLSRLIKTEIFVDTSTSYSEAIKSARQPFRSTLLRSETLQIYGGIAERFWYRDNNFENFEYTIETIVKYKNRSVPIRIYSYYNKISFEETILTVHNSLRLY